jgi:hypothetical protein
LADSSNTSNTISGEHAMKDSIGETGGGSQIKLAFSISHGGVTVFVQVSRNAK